MSQDQFDNHEEQEEQEELYEHHKIIVDPGQSLMRVDKFLTNRLENVSRSKIQSAAKAGSILVNEKSVKSNHRIHPNDVISVVLPTPVREFEIIPENIPLDILYEDDDVLVVNKICLVTVFAFAHYICQIANRQDIGAFKKSFAVFQGKSFFGSDLGQYIAKAGLFYK